MQTITYILQKEFLQIFRNRQMLPMIFFIPIVQMLILAHAATFEMKNIDLVVVNRDMSTESRILINKFEGSPFFRIKSSLALQDALHLIEKERADMVLIIPEDFEKNIYTKGGSSVQILINGINQNSASLIYTYSTSVIKDFNRDLKVLNTIYENNRNVVIENINTSTIYWFNPRLNYQTYMVPGILVILVTIVGMFLTGMNIVREKEIGTIEQINVTPIRKYHFIVGKLLPFWLIGLLEMAFGLSLGKILFNIPFVGSLWLVFFAVALYLPVVLGVGLFISTITNTQQQAMFVSFFFIIIFILMSGLFTPIESMPDWAQIIVKLNPVAYLMDIMRMVLLKGSGFQDISNKLLFLFGYGVVYLSLAVVRYRKKE